MSNPLFLSITAAGFAATIAQILVLRELLVLFHGNEMSAGFTFAGWLAWAALGSAVAARRTGRARPRESSVALLLILLALALEGLVLAIRGARSVFAIAPGELGSIGTMLSVSLAAPALVCPLAGGLFGLCWVLRRTGNGDTSRRLTIYAGEALGAAAGGVVLFFVLFPLVDALLTAVVGSAALLCVAGWILHRPRSPGGSARATRVIWWLATAATLVVGVFATELRDLSRRWQWGENLAAVVDTPFHNVAVVSQQGETTVFTNGVWLFTAPDPVSVELAVDVPLLLHRRPRRVLLLGGGIAGHMQQVLEHPGIERIDYVEPDPELIPFVEEFLPAEIRSSLGDDRVRIHSQDASTFLRRQAGEYDVILMNVGDPVNAQMNRFYTVEFFRRIRERLRVGGRFTFSVPGGEAMIGPTHLGLVGSVQRTLRDVFPQVAILPGGRVRLVAADETAPLMLQPTLLADRIHRRQLDLAYLDESTLGDLLHPLKLEYLQTILGELEAPRINREFSPVCYFHGLTLTAAEGHPWLRRIVTAAAAVRPLHLGVGFIVAAVLITLFFWAGRGRYRTAVSASVFVQGACGMVLQLVLILAFQILEGFAYKQLALIIAFFMAGMALGAMSVARARRSWPDELPAVRGLAVVQACVTAFPLVLLIFLSPVCAAVRENLTCVVSSWLFSAVSLLAGFLGGAHFSLAALAAAATGAPVERTGGWLYAVDLAGAAGGVFAASLFILPLYGVSLTLVILSAMSFVCLSALLRQSPRSGMVIQSS